MCTNREKRKKFKKKKNADYDNRKGEKNEKEKGGVGARLACLTPLPSLSGVAVKC